MQKVAQKEKKLLEVRKVTQKLQSNLWKALFPPEAACSTYPPPGEDGGFEHAVKSSETPSWVLSSNKLNTEGKQRGNHKREWRTKNVKRKV